MFECTENEFKMLKSFFDIVIIEEEKIEAKPSVAKEIKEDKAEKKTSKKKSKK